MFLLAPLKKLDQLECVGCGHKLEAHMASRCYQVGDDGLCQCRCFIKPGVFRQLLKRLKTRMGEW